MIDGLRRRVTVECMVDYCTKLVECTVGNAGKGVYCEEHRREAKRLYDRRHDRKRRGPGKRARNGSVPSGPRGNPSQFTEKDLAVIRGMLDDGATQKYIASQFGVSASYVGTIARGEGPIYLANGSAP